MQINLVTENSRVKKIKYPDGQVSVQLGTLQGTPLHTPLWIVSRFNNYEDLMYILATTDALRSVGYHNISLYIPCFLGQRSDKAFEDGQSFDLSIYTKIINSQGYTSVKILHPHSSVLPALLDNRIVQTNDELVDWAVEGMEAGLLKANGRHHITDKYKVVLVSPDAGAYKTVFNHSERLDRHVIAANKCRNKNGLNLRISEILEGETCLIVDDYCDGGRTFIELAQKLRNNGAGKVYLCVTHGLFSNGYQDLAVALDGIYCTNSISDAEHGTWLRQLKVI